MKRIVIFLLLTVAFQGFAQGFLYPKNGERRSIQKESILIEWRSNKVSFLSADGTKREKIRFKNLDSIVYDGITFKTFSVKNKPFGYYVISKYNGYTLATLNKRYTVSRGGYPVNYSKHEVAVFKKDELVEQISFTENNDRRNIEARQETLKLIEQYFGGCPSVREKLSVPYEGALEHGAIVRFLSPPGKLGCR